MDGAPGSGNGEEGGVSGGTWMEIDKDGFQGAIIISGDTRG